MISGGTVDVYNSTFIGNTCAGSGCAIFNNGGTLTSTFNTYLDNTSDTSGNTDTIHHGTGTSYWYSSIFAHSTDQTNPVCGGNPPGGGLENGRVVWNGPDAHGCGLSEVVRTTDPKLGDQTGFPPHLPLGGGSSAIGFARDTDCETHQDRRQGRQAARDELRCGARSSGLWLWQPRKASGSGPYVRPTDIPCTGAWLNDRTGYRIRASYDICDGAQFERRDISAIGIQWIVDAGPLDVVDAWGWIRPTAEICFPQAGSMLFISTSNGARSVTPLDSFRDGHYSCGRIEVAGTIVLLPADSPHSTPPADNPPGPLVAPVPEQQEEVPAEPTAVPTAIPSTPLSNCMVRTNSYLEYVGNRPMAGSWDWCPGRPG